MGAVRVRGERVFWLNTCDIYGAARFACVGSGFAWTNRGAQVLSNADAPG